MPSCGFGDCGRPDCRPCWWARQAPPAGRSASTHEPMREDARPDLPPARGSRVPADAPVYNEDGRLIAAPKRKHRVGPTR